MESNGKALADLTDPVTGAVVVKKGQQLSSRFAQLRDDGTTSSGLLDLRRELDAGRQPDGPPR